MSDDGHRYTFAGFDGPYWEAKARREAEEEEPFVNYYCGQCHDWHGPGWDED